MIKAQAILGEAAANYYAEKGKIPSAGWLRQHDGEIKKVEFETEAEYRAFCQGVQCTIGCQDATVVRTDNP